MRRGGWLAVLVTVGLVGACSGGDAGFFDTVGNTALTSVPGGSMPTATGWPADDGSPAGTGSPGSTGSPNDTGAPGTDTSPATASPDTSPGDTSQPAPGGVAEVGGPITSNTTWAGDVHVVDSVTVQPGVTLIIAPGTRVMFQHYRDYRDPARRLALVAEQATIIAEGTAEAPIYFTSDAPDPQNGDWRMVVLRHSPNSVFRYCVFEFALQGLNVWDSSPVIEHCVVRWNNWEGLYFESYSNPFIAHTSIYQNGYNGIAAEQFNDLTLQRVEIVDNGTNGLHLDASSALVMDSLVAGNAARGLSVDNGGSLRVEGVLVEGNRAGINFDQGANVLQVGNSTIGGNQNCDVCVPYQEVPTAASYSGTPEVGFQADMSHALGYIPGDQALDGYPYIYANEDETRRVVRKIGDGLGLTWSLAWDGQAIWTATLGATYYRLDPQTGQVLQQFQGPGVQPWGLAWDGGSLWMVDFAQKALYQIDPATGAVLAQFSTPDPLGGCKGIAWDGQYLYVLGWATHALYKMDRLGNLIETIPLPDGGAGGLAWDGQYFWMPWGSRILKVSPQGNQVGWIYAASEGTWDMTWADGLLWASQRTNENWLDPKIYAIEVLDAHG